MKRTLAIKVLSIFAIMWGGSILWLIDLAAKGKIPWLVPILCVPIYSILLYSLRPFWRRARQKASN